MDAHSNLTVLRGIGAAKEQCFAALGIQTVSDLLLHLPRSFRENRVVLLCEAPETEPCMVRLAVQSAPRVSYFGKKRTMRFSASDESGKAQVLFFYQPYLAASFQAGKSYYFYGRVTRDAKGGYVLLSPEHEDGSGILEPVTPQYSLVRTLSQRALRKAIQQVLPYAEEWFSEESLPQGIRERAGLCTKAQALLWVHAPKSLEEAHCGLRRLAFEELFQFRLDLLLLQQKRGIPSASPMHAVSLAPFFQSLPFEPTKAQMRVIAEISGDLIGTGREKSIPAMHRLLQGDVGSGKTLPAAAAIYLTMQNGRQAALMAPTSLLAAQHARKLSALFSPFGFETLLLTGDTGEAQRRVIEQKLHSGEPCLLVGTHALIGERFEGSAISLTIIDEQHRFGVNARDTLNQKAKDKHLLSMSATPIPRTLALFFFSRKDISVLDELPAGRTPIQTYYVGEDKRERMDAFIKKELAEGGRAYIVCPLIEESEESDLMAAESRYEKAVSVFAPYRVGFLHGRLRPKEKEAAMRAFAAGETQVLVSTTVVEIGIDVPEASVMCIENAERFGLATLHQLRGRVGRGTRASACILMSACAGKKARARLAELRRETDGFRLAEYDLKERGAGDFFGVAQSGKAVFSAVMETDKELLVEVARAAEDFFEKNG